MTGETVTYSLETVLARIEAKIDRVDERLTKLEIGQADLKGDIKALDAKVTAIDKRLEKVEGAQQKQIWSLITLIIGAVVVAGWKSFFAGTP